MNTQALTVVFNSMLEIPSLFDSIPTELRSLVLEYARTLCGIVDAPFSDDEIRSLVETTPAITMTFFNSHGCHVCRWSRKYERFTDGWRTAMMDGILMTRPLRAIPFDASAVVRWLTGRFGPVDQPPFDAGFWFHGFVPTCVLLDLASIFRLLMVRFAGVGIPDPDILARKRTLQFLNDVVTYLVGGPPLVETYLRGNLLFSHTTHGSVSGIPVPTEAEINGKLSKKKLQRIEGRIVRYIGMLTEVIERM